MPQPHCKNDTSKVRIWLSLLIVMNVCYEVASSTYGVVLFDPSLRTISMPFLLTTPMTALFDPKSIPKT